jgi:hypothetical protein
MILFLILISALIEYSLIRSKKADLKRTEKLNITSALLLSSKKGGSIQPQNHS